MNRDKVEEWMTAQAKMKHYKKLEGELRREICDALLEGQVGKVTEKMEFETDGGRLVVKATSVVNRGVDEEQLTQLYADGQLTDEDNLCFVRKLAIVDKFLNKLPSTSNVWKAITEKPGMPKLEAKAYES